MTFSDLIKEKGYTAATLAEVVGCDKNTIRRYESGTSTFWSARFSLAYKISAALGVNMADLVALDGQAEHQKAK